MPLVGEAGGRYPVVIDPREFAALPKSDDSGAKQTCDKSAQILSVIMGASGALFGAVFAPDETMRYILGIGLGASGYFLGRAAGKPFENGADLLWAGRAVSATGTAIVVYFSGYGDANPYVVYPAAAGGAAVVFGPVIAKQLQLSANILGVIAKPFTGILSVFGDFSQCMSEVWDAFDPRLIAGQKQGWSKEQFVAALSGDSDVQECLRQKITAHPEIFGVQDQSRPYLGIYEQNASSATGYINTSNWRQSGIETIKSNATIMAPLQSCFGNTLPATNSPKPCYTTKATGEWWYHQQADGKLCRVDHAQAQRLCGNSPTIVSAAQMSDALTRQGQVNVCS